MEFVGAFVSGILSFIGFAAICLGVYKVSQIATDIREIKGLIASARRNSLSPEPLAPSIAAAVTPDIAKDLMGDDSASAYAEHLMRAVNAESRRAENEPHEVR